MQNIVLINNSRTTWPTEILMPYLFFADNLLQGAYLIFQKSFDNFEVAHNTCPILAGVQFSLKTLSKLICDSKLQKVG